MSWRRLDATYSGNDRGLRQEWEAKFTFVNTMDRAYMVIVNDRVGNLEATHSLPIRTLWYLGDPAV